MQRIFIQPTLVLSLTLSFGACSTLPERAAVIPSYSQNIDTQNTDLAYLTQKFKQQYPYKTGYHVLYEPNEALIRRLHLIEHAEKSLDLQYYIWENDKVGALALAGLLKAADRGVQVRLLIDDNNSKNLEAAYYALAQHPNIQIRLFNPSKFRNLRALDFVLDFNRMTRRMHNKTFIVDHQVALIGGRNMSDQYYNVGDSFQFADMDVILIGQTVPDITSSFDEYWNHDYAYPVAQLSQHKASRLSYDNLRDQLTTHRQKHEQQYYADLAKTELNILKKFTQPNFFNWVDAKVVKDSADKIRSDYANEYHVGFQLLNLLQPQKQMDLVSAYFVPEQVNIERIKALQESGVNIRVLTNSFMANDVAVVHAFYAKYRKDLLLNGVELYEFFPTLPSALIKSGGGSLNPFTQKNSSKQKSSNAMSNSSLHAKFMALDQEKVFIGSFNFDPRSAYLNTEIGVVLDSPTLATDIHQQMNQNLMKYAYRVELDDKGQLQWRQRQGQQDIIHRQEPLMKWWHKLGLKVISWLPIEKQM